MFYGQIMLQGYLSDPAVSFCAVGDAQHDRAALQIAEFGQGKQIDQLISKIYLEGGGGPGFIESYELAAYFYLNHFDNSKAELPFFFITGDEKFYKTVASSTIKQVFGEEISDAKVDAKDLWNALKKRFNVFHIHKPYHDSKKDAQVKSQWCETIGKEHVLCISNPKAVIDVVLGAIAITSGARSLEGYIQDMQNRGQTKERIEEVTAALKLFDSTHTADKTVGFLSQPPVELPINQEESKKEDPRKDIFDKIKDIYLKKEMSEELDLEYQEYKKELKDLRALFKDKVPDDFSCPITGDIFYDPVMTEDGHTYERNAITIWLENHNTSPVTNAELSSKNLIPNQILKKLIKEFHEANRISLLKK